MKRSKLDIYSYTDYRSFISDRIAELKARDSKFSFRYLSDRMGLSSKSYLKMVLDGSRNISVQRLLKLAVALGLTGKQAEFLEALMRYGQAKSPTEQADALAVLRRKRRFSSVHRIELDRMDYLSDPVALALREMVTFPDFEEDPGWIAKRLPERVGHKRIEQCIDFLLSSGLLVRDEQDRLSVVSRHQETGDDLESVSLRLFYQKTFGLAAESLSLPASKRHLGGMTMAVSQDSYSKIIERYREFYEDIRKIADEDEASDRVLQMVMAVFPLTKTLKPEDDPVGQ